MLVPRLNKKGRPEILFNRILMLMWFLGALLQLYLAFGEPADERALEGATEGMASRAAVVVPQTRHEPWSKLLIRGLDRDSCIGSLLKATRLYIRSFDHG